MTLMREKRLRLGSIELAIAMEDGRAERIRQNTIYQRLVRPILDHLQGLSNNQTRDQQLIEPSRVISDLSKEVTPEARTLLDRIAKIDWYHTLELPHGITTPGFVDHRDQVHLYGLSEDMRGLRVLDVATYDGFWAFEMERRGAEVISIDIDSWLQCDIPPRWINEAIEKGANRPTGEGFYLAKELLGSKVERKILNVYDLSPKEVGTFDLVLVSDLLLHLRDPQLALQNIFSVVDENGFAIIAEPYNPDLDKYRDVTLTQFISFFEAVWWMPSRATLKAMMRVAGFEKIEEVSQFILQAKSVAPIHKVVLKGYGQGAKKVENG